MKRSQFYKSLVLGLIVVLSGTQGFAKSKQKQKQKPPQVEVEQPLIPRKISDIKTLKVMSYNVENLFLSKIDRTDGYAPAEPVGKKSKKEKVQQEQETEIKSPEALEGVARAINEVNPDIMIAVEVEDLYALETLSKVYLHDHYNAYLIEGNDTRGIDIGFLVKKDLPFIVEIETHKDFIAKDPVDNKKIKIFSRDLPNLLLRTDINKDPEFIIFGNHAKSKRDRNNDPLSTKLRTAQYEAATEIISSYTTKYPNAFILLGGDFNTDVRSSSEVDPLKAIMGSSFDFANQTLAPKDRITHTLHMNGQPAEYSQLDDLMITPNLNSRVISANIYRYKNADGTIKPLPKTFEERAKNPSDHMPPWIVLDVDGLL